MQQCADCAAKIRLQLSIDDCLRIRDLLERRAAQLTSGPERAAVERLVSIVGDAQYLAWWKREQVSLLLNPDDAKSLRDSLVSIWPQAGFLSQWKLIEDALGSRFATAETG